MQFALPNLLWLLLVVPPALVAFLWWSERKRHALLQHFVQARLLPNLLAGISDKRRRVRQACFVLAMAFVIIALARPQWGFTWEEVHQRGLDIVVAIDVSKSMLAEDVAPNRLARAKLAALDLMQRAATDRLGLVAFAGSAFLQCPLTVDDSVFRQSVESLSVQSVSRGGTAISEAIQAAMGAFTEGDNYKVLVLLTDGEDHDSGALETAKGAVEKGLELFTIGIGNKEGELVRVKDHSGKSDFVRDENGNAIKSRLNEEILQQLAGLSNRGFYLPLQGTRVIDMLYEKGLAPIPKSESGEKLVKRFHERYHWPLGIALLLLIVETLIPERKRQGKATSSATPAFKQSIPVLLLTFCVLLPAHGSPRSASKAYDDGDYDRALQEYQKSLRQGKKDPRLNFNAGDAAFRSKQLQEAVNQFTEALTAQDLDLQQRAYYNRGNTFYHLGDLSPDPQNKTQAWQRSLKDYDSALKLNPKDPDAAFNRDYVKRKLEELQNQQQQQQQQKQDDKDQQKQDQNQQDQKQDQKDQNQDQQQKQDQQKDQQQGGSGKQQKDQQQKNQEQQKQNQASQQKEDQKNQDGQDQNQQQNQQKQKPEESEPQNQQQGSQPQQPGQMTPEQARRLLDAQKGDEKILQFKPEEKFSAGPTRDW